MSRKHTLWATLVVLAHLVVGVAHDMAHKDLVVELTTFQNGFVNLFYLGLPIVAAVLVWTPLARSGAALLALSMAASLVFGIWFHFIFVSPDHVAHLPAGNQQTLFQVTAALMVLVNAAGAWLGLRLLRAARSSAS